MKPLISTVHASGFLALTHNLRSEAFVGQNSVGGRLTGDEVAVVVNVVTVGLTLRMNNHRVCLMSATASPLSRAIPGEGVLISGCASGPWTRIRHQLRPRKLISASFACWHQASCCPCSRVFTSCAPNLDHASRRHFFVFVSFHLFSSKKFALGLAVPRTKVAVLTSADFDQLSLQKAQASGTLHPRIL